MPNRFTIMYTKCMFTLRFPQRKRPRLIRPRSLARPGAPPAPCLATCLALPSSAWEMLARPRSPAPLCTAPLRPARTRPSALPCNTGHLSHPASPCPHSDFARPDPLPPVPPRSRAARTLARPPPLCSALRHSDSPHSRARLSATHVYQPCPAAPFPFKFSTAPPRLAPRPAQQPRQVLSCSLLAASILVSCPHSCSSACIFNHKHNFH